MKKVIVLALVLSTFSIISAQAQSVINSRTNLKGPKAKNHKVWNNTYENSTEIVGVDSNLKGPEAKNQKAENREVNNNSIISKGGQRLMGPKAKNQRP